jgi:hypothetical protein
MLCRVWVARASLQHTGPCWNGYEKVVRPFESTERVGVRANACVRVCVRVCVCVTVSADHDVGCCSALFEFFQRPQNLSFALAANVTTRESEARVELLLPFESKRVLLCILRSLVREMTATPEPLKRTINVVTTRDLAGLRSEQLQEEMMPSSFNT